MNKTALVPCIVRTDGLAEEDSLAENVQRAPLHPLDQFRAFQAMREKGRTEEEIAAAFFVSASVVKQRLKLAAVSPILLDIYAEDGMTLDQLMAFTVSGDHARQEQVFERLKASYDKQPYVIRRMLTEGAVRASRPASCRVHPASHALCRVDRARSLNSRPAPGRRRRLATTWRWSTAGANPAAARSCRGGLRLKGWKWIEVALDLPYGLQLQAAVPTRRAGVAHG